MISDAVEIYGKDEKDVPFKEKLDRFIRYIFLLMTSPVAKTNNASIFLIGCPSRRNWTGSSGTPFNLYVFLAEEFSFGFS